MIVYKCVGSHNETLSILKLHPLTKAVVIEDLPDDGRREHFPERPQFAPWNAKRRIAELPEPPEERR